MQKENVFSIVKHVITEVLPDVDPETVEIKQNLKAMGANSIERTEIVVLAMEKLDIQLPLISFGGAENIEDMVDVLASNC